MSTYSEYINNETVKRQLFTSQLSSNMRNQELLHYQDSLLHKQRVKSNSTEQQQMRHQIFNSNEYKRMALQLDKPILQIEEKPKKVYDRDLKRKLNCVRLNAECDSKVQELLTRYQETMKYTDEGVGGNYPEYQYRLEQALQDRENEQQQSMFSKYYSKPADHSRQFLNPSVAQKQKSSNYGSQSKYQTQKSVNTDLKRDLNAQTDNLQHNESELSQNLKVKQTTEQQQEQTAIAYQTLQNKYQTTVKPSFGSNTASDKNNQKKPLIYVDQQHEEHKNTPKKAVHFDDPSSSHDIKIQAKTTQDQQQQLVQLPEQQQPIDHQYQTPKTQQSNKPPFSVQSSQTASHFAKETIIQSIEEPVYREGDLTMDDFLDDKPQNVLITSSLFEDKPKESPANQIFHERIEKLAEIDEEKLTRKREHKMLEQEFIDEESDLLKQLKQQNEKLKQELQRTRQTQEQQQNELRQQIQNMQHNQIVQNGDQPAVFLDNQNFQTSYQQASNQQSVLLTPGGPAASVIRTVPPPNEQSQLSSISNIVSNKMHQKQVSPEQQQLKNEILQAIIKKGNQTNSLDLDDENQVLTVQQEIEQTKQNVDQYLTQKQKVLDMFHIKVSKNCESAAPRKSTYRKQGYIDFDQAHQQHYMNQFVDEVQMTEIREEEARKSQMRSQYAQMIATSAERNRKSNNGKFEIDIQKAQLIEQKYREFLAQKYKK